MHNFIHNATMLTILKNISLTLLLSCAGFAAFAEKDQALVISRNEAIDAANYINRNNVRDLVLYCGCCDDTQMEYVRVEKATAVLAGDKVNFELRISGYKSSGLRFTAPVDLAYTHVQVGNKAMPLGTMAGAGVLPCIEPFPWPAQQMSVLNTVKPYDSIPPRVIPDVPVVVVAVPKADSAAIAVPQTPVAAKPASKTKEAVAKAVKIKEPKAPKIVAKADRTEPKPKEPKAAVVKSEKAKPEPKPVQPKAPVASKPKSDTQKHAAPKPEPKAVAKTPSRQEAAKPVAKAPVKPAPPQNRELPEFDGDLAAYIKTNMRNPPGSLGKKTEATATVNFVVNEDGRISGFSVSQTSGVISLDNEALRLVRKMPNWKPAVKDGKPVKAYHKLPITFTAPAAAGAM